MMHVWGSNLTFVCDTQECSLQQCMQEWTTVVHVHDHEVEMHGVGCREKQKINQV